MISEEQLNLIRKYLEESENPIFFFDDDTDGLSSYLLFRKYINRGHGIILKTSPALSEKYLNKIEEYKPDKIFVLDKPLIDQDFIDKINVPIIWIDHHPPVKREGVKYFNPRIEDSKDSRSTSYWCYRVVNQNQWIAAIGIIGDWQIPDFLPELIKKYPDLFNKANTPPKLLFTTKFGRLCKIVSFLTKGKSSILKNNLDLLLKIQDPYDLLEGRTKEGKILLEQAQKVEKEYNELLEQAINTKPEKNVLLFIYPSKKTSFTGELSNELLFKLKNKIIIIGREKEDRIKLSLRSPKKPILKAVEKALEGVNGYGGGHEHACGANIYKEDFSKFIENFKEAL